MSLTDIAPSSLKFQKIMHKIESGEIRVPGFQRGFVWKQDQVIDILFQCCPVDVQSKKVNNT